MEKLNEALMNAEMAYSNNQYDESLFWYQKVLDEQPDDLYVLSRAGAIGVALGMFEEALTYFGHAIEIDPENGDNLYNYANACFFNKDIVTAFQYYVSAEKAGCSEDVLPILYYQLGLICSMRQDIKSALAYFRKCEETDKSGVISLNPKYISEKLKLFMVEQDYDNAEKTAEQLVAIQPTNLEHYMVCFSILMAHKKYEDAISVLSDAEKYAVLTADDELDLLLQRLSVYVEKGLEEGGAYFEEAIDFVSDYIDTHPLSIEQSVRLRMAIAEAYIKNEKYDAAIEFLEPIVADEEEKQESDFNEEAIPDLSEYEILQMMEDDIWLINKKIDDGELDSDLGLYAETDYDSDGHEYRKYDFDAFESKKAESEQIQDDENQQQNSSKYELSESETDTVYFDLLNALMGKGEFSKAENYANLLKNSNDIFFAYSGMYYGALIKRKTEGNSISTQHAYDEALAFFRNKMFEDHGDALAAIFRAKLYAESNKREKAIEIAKLLADEDRTAVMDYIDSCK